MKGKEARHVRQAREPCDVEIRNPNKKANKLPKLTVECHVG